VGRGSLLPTAADLIQPVPAWPSTRIFSCFCSCRRSLAFITPCRLEWRNGSILVASLLFYFIGAPGALPILLFSIVLNFGFGLVLFSTPSLLLLALGVGVNLAFLIYYKYATFAFGVVDVFAGGEILTIPKIDLPIGISFFTFQAISYLVDSFRRRIRPSRSLIDFAMYHSLFPQLVAQPSSSWPAANSAGDY
jgi:alginate O-acetyltransferase complex protein AlgI